MNCESESVSEHKNRLIVAVTIATISVILFGAVSFVFFPMEPTKPNNPIYVAGPTGATSAAGVASPLPAIVISSDGNVNSTALKQTGNLYNQTDDINNQAIVVETDNIVIDGSGYAFSGSQINLEDHSNITIRNMQFTNASSINLKDSSNCIITENSVPKTPNIISLWLSLENSSDNIISANNLTMANIELMDSPNNTFTNNSISDADSFGISIGWNSNNNLISNNYFENILTPVEVEYDQNVISNNNMVNCDQGVRVVRSSGNTVFGNNMTFADLGYLSEDSDWMTGIIIDGSNNTVYQNIVTGFALAGISIDGGGNTILSNGTRVPAQALGNAFFENIIADNKYGIIIGPQGGAAVDNNTIYHNDFINNYQTVLVSSPDSIESNDGSAYYVNFWDNGFEGNYWSDYTQRYPGALEINSSGVMNLPYTINGNNSDFYPLKQPYLAENISNYSNPFSGQTPFPYAICQTQPYPNGKVGPQNNYYIYVEFYSLPPNVTLQLNPAVPIANVTTTLRASTFNLAEPLLASTTYTATVIYGDGSNTQSYTWNFATPSYS